MPRAYVRTRKAASVRRIGSPHGRMVAWSRGRVVAYLRGCMVAQ